MELVSGDHFGRVYRAWRVPFTLFSFLSYPHSFYSFFFLSRSSPLLSLLFMPPKTHDTQHRVSFNARRAPFTAHLINVFSHSVHPRGTLFLLWDNTEPIGTVQLPLGIDSTCHSTMLKIRINHVRDERMLIFQLEFLVFFFVLSLFPFEGRVFRCQMAYTHICYPNCRV